MLNGYNIETSYFGVGYSSLSMLSSVPIDILKTDGPFVRNIENSDKDKNLTGLIVNIARDIDVPVIADGVWT